MPHGRGIGCRTTPCRDSRGRVAPGDNSTRSPRKLRVVSWGRLASHRRPSESFGSRASTPIVFRSMRRAGLFSRPSSPRPVSDRLPATLNPRRPDTSSMASERIIVGVNQPDGVEEVPITTLIPAFIISELKTAFQIGFLLFIPFIVIDMIVASTLMALGMMMLPPVMISLPFKILLFVLVDGWHLIVEKLILSIR